MKIKVVKNEHEYETALNRASALMDATAGSPEAEELKLLATILQSYEAKRFPIGPPDPIAFIKFRKDQTFN